MRRLIQYHSLLRTLASRTLSVMMMVMLAGGVGVSVGFGFGVVSAPAYAESETGTELLEAFLENTPSAQMSFTQTSYDSDGTETSKLPGRFWFQRPNRFRMEYAKPAELVMVSDGTQMWTYEPGLQQVIVTEPEAAVGESALADALSAGDLNALHERYVMSSETSTSQEDGEWKWAVARARSEDQPVQKLRMGFAVDGKLWLVELTDAFGGVARLDIIDVVRKDLKPSIFSFTPPPGTEVVSGQW